MIVAYRDQFFNDLLQLSKDETYIDSALPRSEFTLYLKENIFR